MWELDCEESWAPKNWCFWTVVLEKTLESPLDCKEIQSVNSKGDQSWVFIGRTDAKAEDPILWPPDSKSWLIGKDPDARRDWGQEKGMTDGWMASLTQWTWVRANSGKWWRTGKPGVLQSMGSQRVGHILATREQECFIALHTFSCALPYLFLQTTQQSRQHYHPVLQRRNQARRFWASGLTLCRGQSQGFWIQGGLTTGLSLDFFS